MGYLAERFGTLAVVVGEDASIVGEIRLGHGDEGFQASPQGVQGPRRVVETYCKTFTKIVDATIAEVSRQTRRLVAMHSARASID